MSKLAVVQKNPPFLDKEGCIECAVDSIGEAAA